MLHKHLPGVEVWAYGSRVNGRSHDGSDLDLVLRGPQLAEIDASQLAEITEVLREATVPFLIEARDWATPAEKLSPRDRARACGAGGARGADCDG